MIRIKFEVEEEETPLPIENENDRIKRILSLKFFGNNLNNSTIDNTNNGNNNNNVCGILKQKSPELNGMVPKIKKQLDNSTTDSVAVCSKSTKTELAESSLSLTTQLNNSLNIQSLLRQNRIQNGWTTNEQSIPIGTQQQQQQSVLSTKIEPIVSEIHQEVPLSLDLSSLIPNLNFEQSVNCDTEEIPSLVQSVSIPNGTQQQQQQSLFSTKTEPIVSEIHQEVSLSLEQSSLIPNPGETMTNCDTTEVPLLLDQSSSLIPIGTQQQQQQSLLSTKIESIFPGIHQEVSLFLDQSSSLIQHSNSEKTTTATNCDTTTTTEMFSGLRAGLGRRAKLNVCYTEPMEPNQFTTTTAIQRNSDFASNFESTNNDDNFGDQDYTFSGFGSISGVDPSSILSSTGPPSPPLPEAAVPLLVGKKALPLGIPPLTSLEEKKARQREYSRLYYHRKKANPKIEQPVDPEVRAEKLLRNREYNRKWRQQRLASATPEQRELIRLKGLEKVRRHMEKESEEQRQQRLERARQFKRTVGKQRMEQRLPNATPEQREQIRLKQLEYGRRYM